jgi:uncharacterized protein YgiM (DUF1202 family)
MKRTLMAAMLLALAAAAVLSPAPASCREYAVMLSRNINIRTGPGTDRAIVGRAWKGDLFELVGETGTWYKIRMFSGDDRYVSKRWAARLTQSQILPGHGMRLPAEEERRRALYRDIQGAMARARGEAEEMISVSLDAERNANLERVLEDRFVLEVFAIHSVPPALYPDLVQEAQDKGW